MMKRILLISLLLPIVAFGRETAYQALRVVGAERSQALLNSVIEIKGRNGTPQPDSWVLLLEDPVARGGVREIEVSKGHIISERTPVKTYTGQGQGIAINIKQLNLDSEGAFSVAEAEARQAHLGFFGADYLLRADETSGAPIWVVQLLDEKQHSIGSVNIAATTGTVVTKTFGGKTTKGSWAAGGGLKGHIIKYYNDAGRSIRHMGASVEEFLTGERTLENPD